VSKLFGATADDYCHQRHRVPPREMTRLPPLGASTIAWDSTRVPDLLCFFVDCVLQGRDGAAAAAGSDGLAVTEQQVAKLMEEDMGTAMQYLQGKGLCLMPVSLAAAISSATCHMRPPVGGPGVAAGHHMAAMRLPHVTNGGAGADDVSASPSMSMLTTPSAMPNGAGAGVDGKDAASVSKP
jgi:hypothetical protein